jgi:hypothetical protein
MKAKGGANAVASLIGALKLAYAEAGMDCGDGLLPPASKADLDRMAFELSMPLPAELLATYGVHGGQEEVSGVSGLFGWHRLISPREVVATYRENCELRTLLQNEPWDPLLIPFATWDALNLGIHSESGEVWNWSSNSGGRFDCHRPSIASLLRELLAAVRRGEEARLREYRQPDE